MILRDEDIAAGTGGELVRHGPPGPVAIDSRRLQPGQWFLALSGDRFDGHDFLPHAQAAGCAGAIARQVPEGWDRGFVRVDDGLLALQALASWVRTGFRGTVVGITGSAGKTTTRAMTALVLGAGDADAHAVVHATEGNLNNHIGVPLTILSAPVDADLWVIEMGMNHAGEIDLLQRIARPDVRLITNVGAAHLEGLGDLAGVARAKGELFAGARPGDTCCVNADDAHIAALPVPDGVRVLSFGRPRAHGIDESSTPLDVRLTDAFVDPGTLATRFRVEVQGGGVILGQVDSPGLHLADDACAAIAVGVALHIDTDLIARRLARYQPVGMRLRVEEGPRGSRVINDAYNANPLSTTAALDTLAAVAGRRRVALLGDMLELGSTEAQAHQDVIRHALGCGIDLLGLAGPRYLQAARSLGLRCRDDLLLADDATVLGRLVAPQIAEGDVILAKGSRGMAMERALQSLRAAASEP